VHIRFLRDIPFGELEALQREAMAGVRANPERAEWIVSEPRPTYTHGRAADPRGLLWTRAQAEGRGIAVHGVSRGGQWTFHGPGQVVVYPVLSLRHRGYSTKAVRRFLENLRAGVTDFLRSLGLDADPPLPDKPFGVYVGGAKLVSFGIAVERGITCHGLALYLTDQTAWFAGIHPCGVVGERLTSLHSLDRAPTWEAAADGLVGRLVHRLT
jgi:lipoyl(octanoyl) transferase